MSSYEEKICAAMEYIAEKAVAKASYDKTIQATIIRCEDEITGQYKVKYQDSSFYAYAANTDITYSANTLVYILVPGNDMGNTKTILGTVKKLGTDYLSLVQSAYEVIGTNCILSDEKYELCSYNKEQRVVIYDKTLGEDNSIIIDNVGAKEYFKNTNNLKIGATFKTALDKEQQFRGQYGIHFEIAFRDNATGDTVLRDYVLDSTYVEGNPYKSSGNRETFEIFELDGTNFEYINKIEVFCFGFPLQEVDKPNDIFISKIDISGVNIISQELLNTQCLTILTPNGAYFDDNHFDDEIKVLEGQVRIKGKVISSNLKTVKYFWFIENAGVDIYHEKYNINGGAGWECLNEFADGDWKPSGYQLKITKAQNPAAITRYKCVVLYNDLVLSRVQEIQNLSSDYDISIVSDSGTKFFYDNGTPTLTCLINGGERADYTYVWAETDYKNITTCLAETIEDNNIYNNAETRYNEILDAIKAETMLPAANQKELDEKKAIMNSYNTIQRIEKNKIHKIQMNEIISFKSFKCSVHNEQGLYIGTATIVLTNDLQKKDEYTLVINNGTQVFKYDESGISPTSPSLLKPMSINPLSFTIFDPEGNEVDTQAVDLQKVKWKIPTDNTMISMTETSYGEPIVEDEKNIYTGFAILKYNIANRYNLDNYDNNIELEIKYQDILLTAKTNFTFTKEGEPGTNGTNIVCKIVPNTTDNSNPIPMLTKGVLNYELPIDANKQEWFKVQLWENGILLDENKMSKADITWSILANKYTTTVSDSSSIIVSNEKKGYFTYNGNVFLKKNSIANIVKCTVEYEGLTYYATMPVNIVEDNAGTYKIRLKENTGFQTVLYSADGQKPSYADEVPFELEVTGEINEIREDLSTLEGENALTYTWSIEGKMYINGAWVDCKNLTLNTKGCNKNQINVVPAKTFNGECVTNILKCVIVNNAGGNVGTIAIPIHMLLNRYGNAAINGWDGNSVSIDKNGNGVILAPQVGAGKKENDNSFTGMLMGQVREAGKTNIDTGLFGYKSGTRTLFLNAEDGSAIFGKGGKGQITIDPSSDKALLYSYNFWKNYGTDGKPTSYGSGNQNTEGLLIDLSTPEIKFGDGRFYLHNDGSLFTSNVTATGGTIAGWKLESGLSNSDYRLYQGGVGMAPHSGKYSAFWAGSTDSLNAPFRVSHDGRLTASSGTIGGWSIGGSSLISNNGNTKLHNNGTIEGTNWKIDSSGKAYFYDVQITNNAPSYADTAKLLDFGNFYVQKNGYMQSSSGIIGGWTIGGSSLSGNGKISGGSIAGSAISGGTISGAAISGGSISGSSIDALSVGANVAAFDRIDPLTNIYGGIVVPSLKVETALTVQGKDMATKEMVNALEARVAALEKAK